MLLEAKEFASIVDGEFRGNFVVDKIAIDSRSLKEGETFLALKGDSHDGHNFIKQAIANKCNAIIVNEDFFYNNTEQWFAISFENKFYNFIIVKDTYEALIKVAKHIRNQFTGKVIGITGSVGKTTTKELFRQVFKSQCRVSANLGNLNNHIGLPLSICNMDTKADVAIFEMGMSSSGEIAFLSNILKPNIGVITNVSESHSEFFETIDKIADAKIEILEGMSKEEAILFLNQDNKYYDYLKNIAISKGYKNIYSFALENKNANCYSENYQINFNNVDNFGSTVVANIFTQMVNYKIPSFAKHHILLANLVLGVAYKLNLDIIKVTESIINFQLDYGRGKISKIILNQANLKKEVLLIDDSYNASPTSMKSAIENLQYVKHMGNLFLVLSDMLELGQNSMKQHLELIASINKVTPVMVITIGENMGKMGAELKLSANNINVQVCKNYKEAIDVLNNNLVDKAVVFIKGSKGSNACLVAKSFY